MIYNMNVTTRKIEKINTALIEHFGIPKKNERTPNPLTTLIGTILSQNTNDNNSFKAFQALRKAYPQWRMLENVNVLKIAELIRVAGLANQKSKAIKNVIRYAIEEKKSNTLNALQKMNDEEILRELTSFDGVGVKTAACVLLFSLGRNVCPVDTHVHRTLNRIGIIDTSIPEKTFYTLLPILPPGIAHAFHTNLINLGRKFCTPSNPDCTHCPVKQLCIFPEKNSASTSKNKKSDFLLLDSLY